MECLQCFVSLWLSCSSTCKGPAKDWNPQTFCFCKFQKSSFFEVRNFLEITGFFKLVKFFWKKFGNNFLLLGQKTLFLGQNVQKSWETGVSKNSKLTKILEFVLFQTFQKLWKNDDKLELQKLQKTHSGSKTYSNVQFKARNAGP